MAVMTPDIFESICNTWSDGTVGIVKACKEHSITWEQFRIFKNTSDERKVRYARAFKEKYEFLIQSLSDLEDEMVSAVQACDPKCSNAVGCAYKVKIDNLKWVISKLDPKQFGDRVEMEVTGSIDFASAIDKARKRIQNKGRDPDEDDGK